MPAPASTLALLSRNTAFRRLYAARVVSLLGDWFNLLAALALLRAIGADSAGAFGGVIILKMLPAALLAPLAGVAADRMSRKGLMIGADLLRAVIVAGMLGVLWWPVPGLVYTLLGLQAAVSIFFDPARSALLPDLVAEEDLTTANTLEAATWSAMLALGSALGGLFTEAFGWQAALAVDAASYLISAAFLAGLAAPPPADVPAGRGWLAGFADLAEGVRYIASRAEVWTLALVKPGWSLAGAATLLLTLLGERTFRPADAAASSILAVTVLYTARGLGTGVGPFLARWLSRSEPAAMERLIGVSFLVGAVFYALVSVAPSLGVAAPLVLCAHLGGATCWVFSTIRLQQLVPSRLRGRVFAAEQAAFTLVSAVGNALYGWLSDAHGASTRTLLLGMAASLLIPGAAWQLRQRRLGTLAPLPPADSA